jgi:hypothetical protein
MLYGTNMTPAGAVPGVHATASLALMGPLLLATTQYTVTADPPSSSQGSHDSVKVAVARSHANNYTQLTTSRKQSGEGGV